jgi:hypothetical protein
LSGGIQLYSIRSLEELALSLSVFASECRERLAASEAEIERKAELLEDRCRLWEHRVEYLKKEYYQAGEDDDVLGIAYQLREAELAYQTARYWLNRVEECAGEYARGAARVKEFSDHRVVEACAFLSQKVAELKDYVAAQPGGQTNVAVAHSPAALGVVGSTGAAGMASAAVSAASAAAEAEIVTRLKKLIGLASYTDYAQRIERARAGNDSLRDIPVSQLAAIRGYTEEGYDPLNKALRSRDAAELREYGPYIRAVTEGLRQLPDYVGTVYRGTHLGAEILARYEPGAVVTELAFTSTSASPHSSYSGNAQYTIKSRHGKDVTQISGHNNEREVIFPPGTRFKVLEVSEGKYGTTLISMTDL